MALYTSMNVVLSVAFRGEVCVQCILRMIVKHCRVDNLSMTKEWIE